MLQNTPTPILEHWNNQPFNPVSNFYKSHFGEKVYKIPVSVVDTCPNREGLKGMETCVFCDVWGSDARSEAQDLPMDSQIKKYKRVIGEKFKAKKFLVYFQAYTNSFAKVQAIRENFYRALDHEGVVGVVVGTRPDCISPALLRLWQEIHEKSFVSVELGAQTFDDKKLEWMKRGHNNEQTLKAIKRIQSETDVDLGLHFMFGLPDESREEIREAAQITAELGITNIKLHNLHVLKNTPLEKDYFDHRFTPCTLEEYSEKVGDFLSHLPPHIYVHRLAALASRWDELIAPDWTRHKMSTQQAILDYLKRHNITQGCSL